MPRHVLNASLIFVGIAVVAGLLRYFGEKSTEETLRSATDAGQVDRVYTIGVDNWVGYAPLCADEMARRLAQKGLGLKCINDNANYEERFDALRSGKLDLAVTTVDAYLRDFNSRGASGPLVAIIDESDGGDAIVAHKAAAESIATLKGETRQMALKVAYTPASPSEYLMISIGQHFGIPFNKEDHFSRLETNGSNEALKALLKNRAQVAVLWEPDVTAALKNPDIVKIMGSEDTDGLIVDALAASPQMASKSSEDLRLILGVFFDTLDFYSSNTKRRDSDIAVKLDVKQDEVAALVNGVRWATLLENGITWFDEGPNGYGEKKLTGVLHSTQAILSRAGLVRSSQLSSREILSLINSSVVEALYSSTFGRQSVTSAENKGFRELSASEWQQLKPIGALKVEDITFQPGTSLLTAESRSALDDVAGMLNHYPNYRLVIRGHTSNVGDSEANRQLSLKRASAVLEFLLFNYPIDANRLRAEGYGGEMPLAKLPGESLRGWRYRLPRVELAVVGSQR